MMFDTSIARLLLTLSLVLATVTAFTLGTMAAGVFTDTALVACYPFNGNAADASNNGHGGTVFGATLTVDRFGHPDSAYMFDGSGDYITANATNFPSAERTISVWFYANTMAAHPTVLGYGSAFFMDLNHGETPHSFHIESHNNINDYHKDYLQEPIKRWYHWVITTAPSGTKMYLDGDLIFSNGAYIADTYTSDRILVLGACISPDGTAPYTDSCVGYFDGILDDIRFYNRALSADEVTQLYRENGWPDITNPPLQRPDLSLRPSTVSQYAGMGIYNLDGSGQTASLSVAKTVKATYYVHLQNNGNIVDTLKLSGPAAPAGWTVEYKNYSTGEIITSAVTGAGWSTVLMNPGTVKTVAVYVTPGATVNVGAVAMQTLTVTSVGDPSKQDVGVINTTVPVVNRPDLYVRPSTVTTYSGSGVYNLDGTNQTVGLSVAYGMKATYYVTVKNNGNAPDTFTITGPGAPAGWTVEYKLGSTSITGAVTSTGWTTPLLNPSATVVLTVYVTPSSSAIVGGVATQTVTVTSNGDPTKQDVGVLNTTLPVVNRPDLFLRPSTAPSYIGSGVYNLDGTNQTVGLTVANGAKSHVLPHREEQWEYSGILHHHRSFCSSGLDSHV